MDTGIKHSPEVSVSEARNPNSVLQGRISLFSRLSIGRERTQRGEAATKEHGIYAASSHGYRETLILAKSQQYRTAKRRERRAPKNLRHHERF
jgi:hypothetical protein